MHRDLFFVSPPDPRRLTSNLSISPVMATASAIHQNVVPSEVGWQFVPQYYTYVNKQPNRLHCFYTKTSTFIHGTEGEEVKACFGQQVLFFFISSSLLRSHAIYSGNPQQDHLHRLRGLQSLHSLCRCAVLRQRWYHHSGHRRDVQPW